jgi:hypothetical protein
MNKFIQSVLKLNEIDYSILFCNKNIYIMYDNEECFSVELPVGIGAYADLLKSLKNSITDEINDLELNFNCDKNKLEQLIKINECLI